MKKYKIKPYNSYYYYKQKKVIKKNILRIGGLVGITVIVFVVAGYLNGQNRPSFEPEHSIKTDSQDKPKSQSILEAGETAYHLYAPPTTVKGIYLSGSEANHIDEYIDLAEQTEINSFIIDVKNDAGYLTFHTDNPKLLEMGCVSKKPAIEDMRSMMQKIYRAGIYPIARIVTFKDNVVGKKYPDRVVCDSSGKIFTTPNDSVMWLDPYNKENWDYLLEICKEAERMGFKEIQFDYIRFHESMKPTNTNFPTEKSRTEIISEFVQQMYKALKTDGLYVSADVFGAIITSKIDANIVGQDYGELAKNLDYINPMIYPSHYAQGSFGISYPDLNPYGIILGAMEASQDVVRTIPREERKAKIRPWLQDFTATWVKPHQAYTSKQIKEQIQGVYDAGLSEWILWNAAGNYTKDGLNKSKE
ncbi:MAG: putative glycoside hydrolase [Cellulosilyticaceae bacterium]